MNLRKRVQSRLVRTALDIAGVNIGRTFLAPRYAGSGVIFMLHRIVTGDSVYPGYELPVEDLDAALSFVKASGWDMVSIDEASRRLRDHDERKFACFTFDDGYLDNYTLALPVFAKYNAPMCVYITTGILDRSVRYWWGGLIELVTRNNQLQVPFPNSVIRTFETRTLQQKRAAYDILDDECHRNPAFMESLGSLFQRYNIDSRDLLDQHALTIEQARQLASHPLVTIGSHAMTHRRLSFLSPEEAEREIFDSRRILESALNVPIQHIAYPFGGLNACGEREFAMAHAAGYDSGVTTRRGNVRTDHRKRMCELPRHVLHADLATVRNFLFGTDILVRAATS